MNNYKIFARTIEDEAVKQVETIASSVLGQDANIRIMPDAHAGKGCVIGTTMLIKDKVCPNLVGVDVSCGISLVKTNCDFGARLNELDDVIRKFVPYGFNIHEAVDNEANIINNLRCKSALGENTIKRAMRSLGSLGGGNHFIESYNNGYLAVHSGSRNIGNAVATIYQLLAQQQMMEKKISIEKDLSYLEGNYLEDYLHDIKILDDYAAFNRRKIVNIIQEQLLFFVNEHIETVHNYIDTDDMILRKGAVSAQAREKFVIPLNMRDGILICKGKGNPDWNYSAPHGAGRLYSRSKAKKTVTLDEYKESMKGIYSTCISESTLDEAPFAYKNWQEIAELIEPTAEIIERLTPIYNFKA